MDKIIITQLQVQAAVGILEWELKSTQILLVDLEFEVDAAAIAITDDIHQAVDYSQVRTAIQTYCAKHRVNLLETLAENLAQVLIKQFNLHGLKLRLTKPAIFSDAQGVSVEIYRSQ